MIINNVDPVSLEFARKIVSELIVNTKFEKIYFNDSLGRVLCEDIISNINVPEFDKSPLDGYTFKKENVENASKDNPVRLEVLDVIMAGDVFDGEIKNGQAVRIMTGAKIPSGADCVIKYEETNFTDEYVDIFSPLGKNLNIVRAGEDIKKGEVIIPKGTVITPSEIGIFASLGIEYIDVYKKPIVTVFSTGSELVEVSSELEDGKIRNSNGYMIENLARQFGAEVIQKGIVKDDLQTLVCEYKNALESSDVVISTGGISVGDGDYVMTALDEIGVESIFTRVSAKPGGHIFFGKYREKFVFGLSGNPAAAFMNFYIYVKPILQKLSGKEFKVKKVKSKLLNSFSKTAKVSRILRAETFYKDGEFFSKLSDKQESGVLSSMVNKNSIVILPIGEIVEENQEVEVEFLYD